MHFAPVKNALALPHGISVARNYDGKISANIRKHMRIMQNAVGIAAVRAADKQENIRIYRLYLIRIILIELEGVGLQHLCARTEACTLCGFRRQFRNEPACKHTKTARRAAGGVAFAKIKFSGHFFKL